MTPDEKTDLKLNIVGKIPEIMPDNTDRNRTSPFAFTGNRFEFRAPGSSCNASAPTTVINTAVAQQLKLFKENVDLLISNGIKKDEAIFQTLKKYIKETKDIRFEGNGYSSEWHKEAKERGLKIINSITDAFDAYTSEESKSLFKEFNIFSEKELYARNEFLNEEFVKKLQIESRVLGDIAINHIIPTAIKYQNILIENIKGINSIFKDENFQEYSQTQLKILKDISKHINEIRSQTTEMIQARKNANKLDSYIDKAISYNKYVLPFLESIRYHIDKLELEVDDSMWSLPKYREMLLLH
jgi:glutamine synthetase